MQKINKLLDNKLFFMFYLAIITGIVFLGVSFPIKGFNVLFIGTFDYHVQWQPFYEEFFRLLEEGRVAWSMNLFLGGDFFASKTYYCVGDVFAYFIYILHKFIPTLYAMSIATNLKIFLAGVLFGIYLDKRKVKSFTKYFFTPFFVFSAWQTSYITSVSFTSFYTWIPLLLIGVEDYINYKKPWTSILAVFLLLSTNYYLVWPLCIFLLFYWTIRYLNNNEKFIFIEYFKYSMSYLYIFIIGVLLSAIIWLPSFNSLLNNPRDLMDVKWNFQDYTRIYSSFLFPEKEIFMDSFKYSFSPYRKSQVATYTGILTLVLLPHCYQNKKKFKTYLFLIILMLLSLSSSKVGLLFHFVYSLRYTLLISLGLLLMAINIYDTTTTYDKKVTIITALILILYIVYIFKFAIPTIYPDGNKYYDDTFMLNVDVILIIIYSLMLLFNKVSYTKLILLLVGAFEITTFSINHLWMQTEDARITKDYFKHSKFYLEAYEKLQEYDDEFYRIYSDLYLENAQLGYGVKGLNTYDTLFESSVSDFLYLINFKPNEEWRYVIKEYEALELLDCRYAIIPAKQMDGAVAYTGNSVLLEDLSNEIYHVYDLKNNSHFARTYNKYDDIEKLKAEVNVSYTFDILISMQDTLYVDKEITFDNLNLNSNNERQFFDIREYNNNHIDMNINLENDSLIMFSIPANKGWIIKDNNKKIDFFKGNGGFISLALEKGQHELSFDFKTPYKDIAYMVSGSGLIMLIMLIKKERTVKHQY